MELLKLTSFYISKSKIIFLTFFYDFFALLAKIGSCKTVNKEMNR